MPASLLNHICRFIKLSEEEQELLLPYLKAQQLKKKESLLKEGHICTANYFVTKGCLRMFYINDKGYEQTTQFGIDNWWITDYQSLDRQVASEYHIQAVEPTEIVILDKFKQQELLEKLPKLERYFRLILQKTFAAYQARIKFIYDFSDEERYRHFINAYPEFVQRIPQYLLASYLGFTPEFLSKIKAKRI